jgi:hypothetical protein
MRYADCPSNRTLRRIPALPTTLREPGLAFDAFVPGRRQGRLHPGASAEHPAGDQVPPPNRSSSNRTRLSRAVSALIQRCLAVRAQAPDPFEMSPQRESRISPAGISAHASHPDLSQEFVPKRFADVTPQMGAILRYRCRKRFTAGCLHRRLLRRKDSGMSLADRVLQVSGHGWIS